MEKIQWESFHEISVEDDVFHGNPTLTKHMKTPWRPVVVYDVFYGNSMVMEYLTWNFMKYPWSFHTFLPFHMFFPHKITMEKVVHGNSMKYNTGSSKMHDRLLNYYRRSMKTL